MRLIQFLTLALLCFSGVAINSQTPLKYKVKYQCPPCGCSEDGKIFEQPGACSACTMPFRATITGLEDKPQEAVSRVNVAVLLFNGADIMDVTGPMSVFVHAGFNVLTVAKDKEPKIIGRSLELTPDHTFESLPSAEVIVLPGGGPSESNQDPDIVNWVKERSKDTKTLFSVCSGAFFLGEAGLLNGKEATTFATLIPQLEEQYPLAKVLNNVKYTDNGQIVTSSGLSSGIDASFEVVAKYRGHGRAQDIANHMEYPWLRQHEYARSQLADRYISGLNSLLQRFAVAYSYSNGDAKEWEYRFIIWDEVDMEEMMACLRSEMGKMSNWRESGFKRDKITGVMDHPDLGEGKVEIRLVTKDDEAVLTVTAKRLNLPIDVNP